MATNSIPFFRSLKTRVTLVSLVLFLISIWSLVYFHRNDLKEDLQNLLGAQQFSTASILAADVNQEIDFRLRSLADVAKGITPAIFYNTAKLQLLLEERPILKNLFNGGYFVTTSDGTATASIPLSANRVGLNYSERDHIAAALKQGKSTVSKPVIGKVLQSPVFSMAVPIRNADGMVIGAISGVVDLSKPNFLDNITDNRHGKTGGYLLIAPQHNLYVTATEKKFTMKSTPPPGVNPLFDRYVQGYEGSGVVTDSHGVQVLSSAKKIPAAGWILVARIPTREAFAPIHKMQQHMLLTALILTIVAGCLTWWTVRRQLSPMLDAINSLSLISTDDHSIAPLPVARQDEVGQMVAAFNHLLEIVAVREDNLKERNELIRQLLQNTDQGIYGIDLDGNCTFINWAAATMLGYESEDCIGRNMHDLIHHSYSCGVPYPVENCPIFSARLTGEGCQIDDEILWRSDGTFFQAEYSSYPIFENGMVNGVVVTFSDITERKLAEQRLLESEIRYRDLVENVPAAFYMFSTKRGGLFYSRQVEKIFGYSLENFYENPVLWNNSIHPDDASIVESAIGKLFETGEQEFEIEYRVRAKNGAWVWIRDSSFHTIVSEDEIIVHGFAQDISHVKHAEVEKISLETQLQQAQKMESVGRLAGGIAHDFNNMLTVISGYSNLGVMKADPSSPLLKYFEEILKTSERSAELTHQLLAFARKQAITPTVIDLNEAVMGMFKMLQRLIGEDIHLNLQPASKLWTVNVDPSQIDQILANLCVNARDAIIDVGTVTIETENITIGKDYCATHIDALPGEYVRISVSDNGSGINQETLDHIFEPFFTTKERGEGTGLGLATVFGIVKQNKGFIEVCSEVGKGTTFKIHIPRHEGAETVAKSEMSPEQLPCGTEVILIVEDDPAILEMSALNLSMLGYTVLQADSPDKAIRLAEEHAGKIRLVMTDVIMPGMNGRSLADKLKNSFPELACLFMSGYTADIIGQHGVLDSDVHFIQKPFSLPNLAKKIREVLDSG